LALHETALRIGRRIGFSGRVTRRTVLVAVAAETMGGVPKLQRFNRLFLIPGLAHDSTFSRAASIDPTTGRPTNVDKVPLPQPSTGRDELFTALRRWVEHSQAPHRIDLASANGSVTLPICSYPQKATYRDSGPLTAATSYTCR
jgi:hypothetical protein